MSEKSNNEEKKTITEKYLKYAKNFFYFIALSSIFKDFEEWKGYLEYVSNYLKSFGLLHVIFTSFNWMLEEYSSIMGLIFWFVPEGIGLFFSLILIIFSPIIYNSLKSIRIPIRNNSGLTIISINSSLYYRVLLRYFLTCSFLFILLIIHYYYFDKCSIIASRYLSISSFFIGIVIFSIQLSLLPYYKFTGFILWRIISNVFIIFVLLIVGFAMLFSLYEVLEHLINPNPKYLEPSGLYLYFAISLLGSLSCSYRLKKLKNS